MIIREFFRLLFINTSIFPYAYFCTVDAPRHIKLHKEHMFQAIEKDHERKEPVLYVIFPKKFIY